MFGLTTRREVLLVRFEVRFVDALVPELSRVLHCSLPDLLLLLWAQTV